VTEVCAINAQFRDFIRALGASIVATLCAIVVAWLAWYHPLSPAGAVLVCASLAVLTFMWPDRWALWLLPLLPVAGLMTWTGWLVVEELDLLVLAVAAGGYTRLALGRAGLRQRSQAWPVTGWLLAGVVAVTLLGVWRALDGVGTEHVFGWWQGYREPTNSLRLAKGIALACLLLPLAQSVWRDNPAVASARLTTALCGTLLMAALSVVWERLAFTGLLNFASDYRATGLFWEAHVGGAPLDAVLALTMPFAAAALVQSKTRRGLVLPLLGLGFGLYASLVSFSRIVYLAVPLGLMVWWLSNTLLQARRTGPALRPNAQNPGLPKSASTFAQGLAAGLWLLLYAALAAWLFPLLGYRGLLALLGAVALILPLQGLRSRLALGPLLVALLAGVVGGLAVLAIAWALPKGPYVAYGLVWCLGVGMLGWVWTRGAPMGVFAAVAAAMAVLLIVPAVGQHWGGAPAAWRAAAVAAVLAVVLVVATLRPRPSWPDSLPWQGKLLAGMAALSLCVGVFGGGAYMGSRLASSGDDGLGRVAHWSRAVALLSGPADWFIGKGLGRFAAELSAGGRPEDEPGEVRLAPRKDGNTVVFTSAATAMGSNEALRLSQRVAAPAGVVGDPPVPAVLRMNVRSDARFSLVAEICAKNLLYPEGCTAGQVEVQAAAKASDWQRVELRLKGAPPTTGPWYAPRPLTFSVAIDSPSKRIEIDQLSLVDAEGRDLLKNGSFERGLAHWFISSDRNHLPWHAKNLGVHLLVEQGLVGLAMWTLALAVALWRLLWGPASNRSLAPALAAALVGVLVVGGVDSLVDMPRVAFLMTLLMGLALTLPVSRRTGNGDSVHLGLDSRAAGSRQSTQLSRHSRLDHSRHSHGSRRSGRSGRSNRQG